MTPVCCHPVPMHSVGPLCTCAPFPSSPSPRACKGCTLGHSRCRAGGWREVGRTQRLRDEIHLFLESEGEANTTTILDHVNRRFRWGATMNQIGNVLARDRRFVKVGFYDQSDAGGFRMRVCVWSVSSA